MKITQLGKATTVMHNPDSKHNYFGWPSVAKLQNGKVAAVSSGFRLRHVCPFGKMVISYSEDEGSTYTAPAPVIDTPLDDRDGGIVPFGEKGVIITSFNNSAASQRDWMPKYAPDFADYIEPYLNRITPEDEAKYLGSLFRVSYDCGVTFGPIYKSPVTSPHGPTVMPDGSILWVGTRFAASREEEKTISGLCAYGLNPETGEMTYRGEIEPIYIEGSKMLSCEPHTVALPSGKLICHIRVEGASDHGYNYTTFQTESTDGGCTWTKPHQVIGQHNGAPAHLLLHSSGVLISTYGVRIPPFGVRAMFSCDEGETWDIDNDVWISGVNGDLGYPASCELDDGSILTVFYCHETADAPATIMQQKWTFEK